MPRGVYDRSKANHKPKTRAKRARNAHIPYPSESAAAFTFHKGWLEGFRAAGKIWRDAMRKA